MRWRIAVVVCCALAGVALVHAQNPPRQGQPTFVSSTDVVMVDVSVRKDGKQVTGLTAADFDLRDNGVKQDVETVEPTAVPIDLSLLVDVSGNPDRPWTKLPSISEVAADVEKRVRELTRLLRPGDRVRLFALDTYLQQLWPLQAPGSAPAITHLEFDGLPALYDALLTLLLQPVELNRRHVVVAATRGGDSFSVVSALDLREIARRSDAQFHVLMEERRADEETTVRFFQCMYMDLCRPTYRFWVPARRRLFPAVPIAKGAAPLHRLFPEGDLLKLGAESTGGGVYQAEGLSEPTLLGTFEQAFANFRQSYILRYTPKGVTRTGWHEIKVTVPRERSAQIKARSGYAIEALAPSPSPTPTPTVAAPTLLRSAADVSRAFEESSFDLVRRSLRQIPDPGRFITDFEARGNPWPQHPRREAVLALEVAELGLYAPPPLVREQGDAMLRRFANLVRDPISPDAFEREWLVAASRMLLGTMRPAGSERFVEAAIQRFPDDGRLRFARAIITDQRWPLTGTVGTVAQLTRNIIPESHVSTIAEQYRAAAAFPEFRADAEIRHGWFLHRIGRSAEALTKIEAASVDASDRSLAYLRELLMGQVLQSLDRGPDALTAFRRAVALVPAQSARVAVMNALIMAGDRDQAAALATDLQSNPATLIDPWWMYWQGDYRRYPDSLAKLREMMR